MALFKDHRQDTARYLGDPCDEVHAWLDQYAKHFPVAQFLSYHRSFLHNSYGLKLAKDFWGEKGEKAALIHILRDYMEAPIGYIKLETVFDRARRAVLYMDSHLEDCDPELKPHIIRAWNGKSLVSLAFTD
jgi:hypothetical protein